LERLLFKRHYAERETAVGETLHWDASLRETLLLTRRRCWRDTAVGETLHWERRCAKNDSAVGEKKKVKRVWRRKRLTRARNVREKGWGGRGKVRGLRWGEVRFTGKKKDEQKRKETFVKGDGKEKFSVLRAFRRLRWDCSVKKKESWKKKG
jgi:hypothetical protein